MKSILIIVPYENIYPPMNGGMQRCFHIMHQLAKHFDLTAIIHQDNESFLKCTGEFPAMTKARIFSTKEVSSKDVFSIFPSKMEKAFRSRWYQRELNRPADGSLIKYYPILTYLLKKEKFDIVILENLATLNAVKIIRHCDKKVKIIYDAHNVDSILAKAAFERKEITQTQFKSYQKTEGHLYNIVDAVITCSKNDKEVLEQMNEGKLEIGVVPNGVSIPEQEFNTAVNQPRLTVSFGQEIPRFLLFCGSLWSIPNAEGLHWFCKKIWPLVLQQISSLKLLVVGTGELPAKFAEIKDALNIEFIGSVEDVKPWYNKASVVIVPLLSGSGTRLKILEAMSLGVPVVSTPKGTEGIEYTDGQNILVSEKENEFADQINALLKNKNRRIEIGNAARKLVEEKYNWNIIGHKMAKFINEDLMQDKR